jgi:hypothetical protein
MASIPTADDPRPDDAVVVGKFDFSHANCLEDEGSCPDILTCPTLGKYTLDQVRQFQAEAREADQAAWEAERITYEEELKRQQAEDRAQQERKLTSWAPVDLAAILEGTLKPPQPSHLARTDGICLLYPARTHSFIGVSEHGKTIAAYATCAQELIAGRGVVYVDFEGDGDDFARWMVNLGVPRNVVAERARYCRPDDALDNAAKVALRHACMAVRPSVVVFDGVTEAMMLHDLNDNMATDTARFIKMLPREFERAGGSVILIDHVPHGGNRATGSQHKRSSVTGASYLFTRTTPLIEDQHGKVEITVLKDRPGQVRKQATGGKTVGTMHVKPAPERQGTEVYIEGPSMFGGLQPEAAMERVSRYIEQHNGASRTKVVDEAGGDKMDNRDALGYLVADGYVEEEIKPWGERTIRKYFLLKPFRPGGAESGAE